MAIVRVGTASQVDASAASGSTSVTVPVGATAVIGFFAHFEGTGSDFMSVATLEGTSMLDEIDTKFPAEQLNSNTPATTTGTGILMLSSALPASGSRTFAWAWSDGVARGEGGGVALVWLSGLTSVNQVRDVGLDHQTFSTTASVTIASTPTDLILAMAQSFGGDPLISGASNVFIDGWVVNSEVYDVAEITPGGGSTTLVTNANPNYSTIAALSFIQPSTTATQFQARPAVIRTVA